MPCEPWGANQAATSVSKKISYHHRKVALRDTTTLIARAHFVRQRPHLLPLGPSNIQVTIPFSTNRRRDPHNYTSTVVKAIVDGLRNAGVFTDDTAEHVTVLDPKLVVGTEYIVTIHPRTVRTIT